MDSAKFGKKAKTRKLMEQGKIPGSQYRGRVLLALEAGPAPHGTKAKCSKKGEVMIMKPTIAPVTHKYLLRVDVLEVCDLPFKKNSSDKIIIKLRCADFKTATDAHEVYMGHNYTP